MVSQRKNPGQLPGYKSNCGNEQRATYRFASFSSASNNATVALMSIVRQRTVKTTTMICWRPWMPSIWNPSRLLFVLPAVRERGPTPPPSANRDSTPVIRPTVNASSPGQTGTEVAALPMIAPPHGFARTGTQRAWPSTCELAAANALSPRAARDPLLREIGTSGHRQSGANPPMAVRLILR